MASFSFNFIPPDSTDSQNAATREVESANSSANTTEDQQSLVQTNQTAAETQQQTQPRPPFVWIPNVNELLQDRALEELVYSEIPLVEEDDEATAAANTARTQATVTTTPIRCVDLTVSSFSTLKHVRNEQQYHHHQQQQYQQHGGDSDLEPSIYEGGLKVWECSLDLLRYLAEEVSGSSCCCTTTTTEQQDQQQQHYLLGTSVLELGCGHALPSCFLLRESLRRGLQGDLSSSSPSSMMSFSLTDFNDFVVQDATISNLVLNTTATLIHGEETNAFTFTTPIRLGHGDWLDMSRQFLRNDHPDDPKDGGYFNVILAAETVYSLSAAQDTARLLARHLRPGVGVGLVATKRYYFGVGGGSDAFVQAARATEVLQVETVRVYDNGTGNIRELFRVTRNSNAEA